MRRESTLIRVEFKTVNTCDELIKSRDRYAWLLYAIVVPHFSVFPWIFDRRGQYGLKYE